MRADDDGKTSAFRCLDAARYTVAAVVSVLIVAVIVTSLKVMLRPESLRLSIVRGTVCSSPWPASEAVILQLNLRAENPSRRARMYFLNVTAYLFDGATPPYTSEPDEDCVIFFALPDKAVPPHMAVDWMTIVNGENDPDVMNQTYFHKLYTDAGIIGDATLRVDGSLLTEVNSSFNMTGRQVTYYCQPLLVGKASLSAYYNGGEVAYYNGGEVTYYNGGKASTGRKDVLCTDNLGSQ